MRIVRYIILKNYLVIPITIFLFIFYLPHFLLSCPLFNSLSFDSQAVYTWYYDAVKGILPYRDVFYPYGLLAYYRNVLLIPHIIYEAIMPLLFVLTYILIRKIIKNIFFSLSTFIFFFLFTFRFNGEGFITYGIVAILSSYFAFIFVKKKITKKIVFLVGLSCGLLFSVLHSSGLYLSIIFVAGLACAYYLHNGLKIHTGNILLSRLLVFFLGNLLGIIPFVIFLFYNRAFFNFLTFYSQLSSISQYAKSAFIPYSTSLPNLFSFSVLLLTAFYVAFIFLFKKSKSDLSDYVITQLFLVLVLFENISIIRSIDSLITFIPLLIIFIYLFKIRHLITYSLKTYIFIFISMCITLNLLLNLKPITNFSQNILISDPNICLSVNNKNLLSKNKQYKEIFKQLKARSISRIFSFPADPIFYVLLNQVPPYYFNNYDSSSRIAQQSQIDYLKKNNITTVIYNTSKPAIEDNVPDYIRTPKELSYIITHFQPVEKINSFTLLEKNIRGNTILINSNDKTQFYHSLLKVDLRMIPYSEGKYKREFMQKEILLLKTSDQKNINEYLKSNTIFSQDIVLGIQGKELSKKETEIALTSRGISTSISFKSCQIEFCIIDLGNVPLFYANSRLDSIKSNEDMTIEMINLRDISSFW